MKFTDFMNESIPTKLSDQELKALIYKASDETPWDDWENGLKNHWKSFQ